MSLFDLCGKRGSSLVYEYAVILISEADVGFFDALEDIILLAHREEPFKMAALLNTNCLYAIM